MFMINDRLTQQLAFVIEIDGLKQVIRRSLLTDGSRRENSAEHSWHIALMAIVLAEHANEPVDVCHVVKMLLVHDLVEIDAGDTYVYDLVANLDKEDREQLAATRIFGLLPPEQAAELRGLWDEFEARETTDSRFANTIDRMAPFLLNYQSHGLSWQENGIQPEQVRTLMQRLRPGSELLWEYVDSLITEAITHGYFPIVSNGS